jgi:hypothetical protein
MIQKYSHQAAPENESDELAELWDKLKKACEMVFLQIAINTKKEAVSQLT